MKNECFGSLKQGGKISVNMGHRMFFQKVSTERRACLLVLWNDFAAVTCSRSNGGAGWRSSWQLLGGELADLVNGFPLRRTNKLAMRGEKTSAFNRKPDQPQMRMMNNQGSTSHTHREAGSSHRRRTWDKRSKQPQKKELTSQSVHFYVFCSMCWSVFM